MINILHNQLKRMQRKSIGSLIKMSKISKIIINNNNLSIKWNLITFSGNKRRINKRKTCFLSFVFSIYSLFDTVQYSYIIFPGHLLAAFFFFFIFRYCRMPHNEDINVNKIQFTPDPERIHTVNQRIKTDKSSKDHHNHKWSIISICFTDIRIREKFFFIISIESFWDCVLNYVMVLVSCIHTFNR